MRRMWRDRRSLLEPDEAFDDLARRLATPSLSRRQFAGLAIGGVAAVAMRKVAGSNQTLVTSQAGPQATATPQAGLPPGSPCPAPIQTGQNCGPIDCPFDGTHLTYVGSGTCLINPGFADAVSIIDACAAEAGVTVDVVSAGRTSIPSGGASCSAHLAGHAFDMHLSWTDASGTPHVCLGGPLAEHPCLPGSPYHKACLCPKEIDKEAKHDPNYPPSVFVNCLTSSVSSIRWGGNFSAPDPGHIDDGCAGCSNPCWQNGVALMETTGLLCCNGTCIPCPPEATCATCCNGTSCSPPSTCCTASGVSTCVDLQTDPSNCGSCGHACPGGETCVNGTCSGCGSGGTSCPAGQTCCNGQCVNTGTDSQNCGKCGNTCGPQTICCGGACGSAGTAGANTKCCDDKPFGFYDPSVYKCCGDGSGATCLVVGEFCCTGHNPTWCCTDGTLPGTVATTCCDGGQLGNCCASTDICCPNSTFGCYGGPCP